MSTTLKIYIVAVEDKHSPFGWWLAGTFFRHDAAALLLSKNPKDSKIIEAEITLPEPISIV